MDYVEQDWAFFFILHYFQSTLESPLVVLETLKEIQFQSRPDSDLDTKKGFPRLQGNVSDSIKAVKDEIGVFGLFNGHVTHFIHKSLFAIIQPALEEGINDLIDILDDINPITHVFSVLTTGILLSPLELVRTRLFP